MKILSASVQNFASYKQLDFDFQNQGLVLVAGPMGSGKSTLCDIVPWIIFGRTAKGGAVDEIRSWGADEITLGILDIEYNGGYPTTSLRITRVRGPKPKDNDLYYCIVGFGGDQVRGKDLNDTQRMINQLIGMDYELYLAGAYYHEFSQTAQFFTATAKNRRTICEQIVDLSLAKKLQVRLIGEYKEINKNKQNLQTSINTIESTVNTLSRIQVSENNKAKTWEESHILTKDYVLMNYEKFEASRKKVISNKCSSCNTVLAAPKTIIDKSDNPYIERLAELEREVNPYTDSAKDYTEEIHTERAKLVALHGNLMAFEQELEDIELLQEVTNDFRSISIANTIKYIEDQTNQLLTDHFDAEIRVAFSASDADKLDVAIYKDGNDATYTQLSKGQRCLLKLCFGVSIMAAVQNHHGISFDQIFLDECMDGMPDKFKIKAYGLLETLMQAYNSIFVVEHSEALKACFPNSYSVELINGNSEIEKTN